MSFVLAIITHTPLWVWPLLVALLTLGWLQTRTRRVSQARLAILPLAMFALAINGVVSAFGAHSVALPAWALGFAVTLLALSPMRAPRDLEAWGYDTATREVQVPGSWTPMLLIVSLFVLKYAVGVSLGMQPALRGQMPFVLVVSAAYGVFSAVFTARSLRAMVVARQLSRAAQPVKPLAC